jgi:periplasmic divalent cation tolerance protein
MVAPLTRKSARQVLVILVTTDNQEEAVKIGEEMVHAKLAACANIIPGIQSIYRWKGKVSKAQEVLLILKSTKPRYRALEKAIKEMHTYDIPEIIALPVTEGFDKYIGWVCSEAHSQQSVKGEKSSK